MRDRYKYPRTVHLPDSPGATRDDHRAAADPLIGHDVVVTEKLDGENTTLYRDGVHARSIDSGPHPSRNRVKALQAALGWRLPEDTRLCGENMSARHSIAYDDLAGYFYLFSVWTADWCWSWPRTIALATELGLPTPPVLYRGAWSDARRRDLVVDTARSEGYVVRTTAGFARADFATCVAKWVRAGHVQTDEHWMHRAPVPNGLRPGAPRDASAVLEVTS